MDEMSDFSLDANEHSGAFLTQEPKAASDFDFDVELEVSEPIVTSVTDANIYGRFRHFGDQPIRLQPGITGAFNLGIKLIRAGENLVLFEDRAKCDVDMVEPGVWVSIHLEVPRSKIDFMNIFEVTLDMVKEEEFWFASRGRTARKVELEFVDGAVMGKNRPISNLRKSSGTIKDPGVSIVDTAKYSGTQIVFDVSDLIQYFHNARLPTGIQRVQIEIITNLVLTPPENIELNVCCFTKEADVWLELPLLFFNHICKLALVSGDGAAPDWLRVLEELRLHLSKAKPLIFKRGAYLINLGTSWWLQNYFLHVRDAKARYGIRYVPYVHDCIPIITPEHCVDNLTRDFITWALGAFQHADHVMVNSRATAADVKSVAKRLGHDVEEPQVVTLDADFRSATSRLPQELLPNDAGVDILLRNDLTAGEFVLFVSTIESRKNHLMAFSAWLTLTKRHGPERVPKLVCVGNRGWLNDAIYSKLAASRILQQKVVLLSKISDLDLQTLYRSCLFTLYPSSYEGWGLPVTESLCYGKVPVLADCSSLPEAGGAFAEYFDVRSETDLLRALERMIFDDAYRTERERKIVEGFRARGWVDIANQVVGLVRGWAQRDAPIDEGKEVFTERGLWPFPAKLGRYYGITENMETHIWPGMSSGEIYRQGANWWWPEPWGCWTKPGIARLAFVAPLPEGEAAVLYLGVKGMQGADSEALIRVAGIGDRRVSSKADQTRWIIIRLDTASIRLLPRSSEGVLLEVRFSSDRTADFRALTNGADTRKTSVGISGFMLCGINDFHSRMNFIENLSADDLGRNFLSGNG
jgi:glycosyltransferase involved in cell wall biosynthesis